MGAAGQGPGLRDALWSCLSCRVLLPMSIPAPFGGGDGQTLCERGIPPRLSAALKSPNHSCYKYLATPLREAVRRREAVALGKGGGPRAVVMERGCRGGPCPPGWAPLRRLGLPVVTEAGGHLKSVPAKSAGYRRDLPWDLGNLIGL